MSLATREQKAVVTDFCACRALWFFHAMKERIKIKIDTKKAHGPPRTLEQDNIIHRMFPLCNKRDSFIRAHTKPPQSCEARNPAPPNEEQSNAPTTGCHAMKECINKLDTKKGSRATEELKESILILFCVLSKTF